VAGSGSHMKLFLIIGFGNLVALREKIKGKLLIFALLVAFYFVLGSVTYIKLKLH
jgi:hypothetical protein